jgi:formate dehydrogenase iron-sulfur subunit
VACKEWNTLPMDDPDGRLDVIRLSGESYDNSGKLSANTWRHVAFVEQSRAVDLPMPTVGAPAAPESGPQQAGSGDREIRWLMSSDVCKHCTHAACLDVCPTGSLFRTEYGTVVVQEDICNGCGYCVPACPYGVIDQRENDGRVFKCTLCYDRLVDGLMPACATACPTESIQFGDLDELQARADARLAALRDEGVADARLYGRDEDDGVGGAGAFFLLLDEPEVYGLPPDPIVTTRDLPSMWRHAVGGAALLAGLVVSVFAGRRQ